MDVNAQSSPKPEAYPLTSPKPTRSRYAATASSTRDSSDPSLCLSLTDFGADIMLAASVGCVINGFHQL